MRNRISHFAAIAVLPALLISIPVQEAKAQFFSIVSDPSTEANTFVTHVTQLLQYIKEAQQALQAVQTDLTASPTGMPNPATFTAHVQKMLADAKNDINSAQTKLSGQ